MITRNLQEQIEKQFFKGKAILIIGACQTGKTTLVDTILQNRDETILRFNGDEADTNDILGKATVTKLKRLIKGYSILFFDEAQKIENIGTILKLIVDNIKEVQVIASGSSMAPIQILYQIPMNRKSCSGFLQEVISIRTF
jgi:uncharacterized protein